MKKRVFREHRVNQIHDITNLPTYTFNCIPLPESVCLFKNVLEEHMSRVPNRILLSVHFNAVHLM